MGANLSSVTTQGGYIRSQLGTIDRKFMKKSVLWMLLLYIVIVAMSFFALSWWAFLLHAPILVSIVLQIMCIFMGQGMVVRLLIIVTELNVVCAIAAVVIGAIRLLIFCAVDYGCIIGSIGLGLQLTAELLLLWHLFILYTNVLSFTIYQSYIYRLTLYLLRSAVGANYVPPDKQSSA